MKDRHKLLREMPFDALARALGLDLGRSKQRKGGTEWAGPCPVHQAKKNNTAFSYAADGKWHCFSCDAKGRGSLDLAMAVRSIGFKDAVAFLEPHASAAAVIQQSRKPEIRPVAGPLPDTGQRLQVKATENPPFKSTYEKYFKPHPWLEARGLEPTTLERYGVGSTRTTAASPRTTAL